MNSNVLVWLVVLCSSPGNAIIRTEYRIPLPFTLDECRIGHLWSTAQWAILNSDAEGGVEIVENEPSEFGRYTFKIFRADSKIPNTIRLLAPKGSLFFMEKSWNDFPQVKTEVGSPYMKETFHIKTFSRYVEADDCQQDNIFDGIYSGSRTVIPVDIVNDKINPKEYREDEDPSKCHRGKLNVNPDWKTSEVRVCVYKLVELEFVWHDINSVEGLIQKAATQYFRQLHRQMFCWADKWIDLSMKDIRAFEYKVQQDLMKKRSQGEVMG
ncbi:phosphatidylinositol transfer protein beta isoform-like [Acanthaster planci]|uniref:Phosphatidylinositol transfer protein beta isoform-like n=1 Tax=Acanthaster planci TaxID=133434 RepID=A0A8B7Y389_ACAPL|nr:phosphatidylinositol transfer protein beta isoform-like [Acanthaster planci]